MYCPHLYISNNLAFELGAKVGLPSFIKRNFMSDFDPEYPYATVWGTWSSYSLEGNDVALCAGTTGSACLGADQT